MEPRLAEEAREIPASQPRTETTEVNTPSLKKKKIPAKGFNVLCFEKRVTATFSIMGKLFVIALISIAIIFIARQLADSGYSIKQVNVPLLFKMPITLIR